MTAMNRAASTASRAPRSRRSRTGRDDLLAAGVAALLLALPAIAPAHAQQPGLDATETLPLVVVDGEGVMRHAGSGAEAAFFGVNYAPAFAHGYRALSLLGIDHREVIDQDVYHFARLGLDAYRVHLWDTEISDSLGNVVETEHLRLLDYTLAKLKERGIRAILTPLTFYTNAYPDGATETDGFQNQISKGQAPQPQHRPILKRYLGQLVDHVNPHTGLSYADDPNIIGIEIVNEPSHGRDTTATRDYVNELADHIRESGWRKPVFYNISQSPGAAPAVMTADVEGVSFQWYPAGLVGGREIRQNYLPYVDAYDIPYHGEPAFDAKALMVYEFDAADVPSSYVYPAMARSFREAGFQWATQFAYDPIGIAFANSDYQTHSLNLAYTPSKAISMRIASEAFHRLPRRRDQGAFPADTVFGDFRLSPALDLSEMNSATTFLHSNPTTTAPRDPSTLTRIAGVGSSPVVSYPGLGAYFLDRVDEGVWRLEVMPDAIPVRNPFERPAFDKHVTYIEWRDHPISVRLPDLGTTFSVRGLNEGNTRRGRASGGSFDVSPGTYLLVREGVRADEWTPESAFERIRLGEFAAPAPTAGPPVVRHTPLPSVDAALPVAIEAIVGGTAPSDSVILTANATAGGNARVPMVEVAAGRYVAEIPATLARAGLLRYWITVRRPEGAVTFPGAYPGFPNGWNYYHPERWETQVVASGSGVELFDGRRNFDEVLAAAGGRQLVELDEPGRMAVRVAAATLPGGNSALGFTLPLAGRLAGRSAALASVTDLVVRARSGNRFPVDLKVVLVDRKGNAFSASTPLTDRVEAHRLPLGAFRKDRHMLLPRSYPGFLPFWFRSADEAARLDPAAIEQIQFIVSAADAGDRGEDGYVAEVERAWLSGPE